MIPATMILEIITGHDKPMISEFMRIRNIKDIPQEMRSKIIKEACHMAPAQELSLLSSI